MIPPLHPASSAACSSGCRKWTAPTGHQLARPPIPAHRKSPVQLSPLPAASRPLLSTRTICVHPRNLRLPLTPQEAPPQEPCPITPSPGGLPSASEPSASIREICGSPCPPRGPTTYPQACAPPSSPSSHDSTLADKSLIGENTPASGPPAALSKDEDAPSARRADRSFTVRDWHAGDRADRRKFGSVIR